MPRLFSVNIGAGGSSGVLVARSGVEAIAQGVQNFSVLFSSDIGTTNYAISATFSNDVDTEPIYLTAIVSNKQTTGFDVELSAPTDSANYVIDYLVAAYS